MKKNETKRTFDEKLRKARAKSGLSQSQAAKLIKVPVKTLQNWEQGRAKPAAIVQELVLTKLATQ